VKPIAALGPLCPGVFAAWEHSIRASGCYGPPTVVPKSTG
jgi:hypothetical protein